MATSQFEAFGDLLLATLRDHLRRFNARMTGAGRGLNLQIAVEAHPRTYRVQLSGEGEHASLVFPRARQDQFGNLLLGERCGRALCPLMVVLGNKSRHISYEQMLMYLFFSNVSDLFQNHGTSSHLDRILRGFLATQDSYRMAMEEAHKNPDFKGRKAVAATGRMAVARAQRFLNQNLFNIFPLSGTPLQDWAMNRRLMIFDPIFNTLSPEAKLAYQRRKNEMMYPAGSIGLSDGAAATNNYILETDLKELTAFGLRHHNPIRNLYSTLGMQGEEPPLVISASAKALEDRGIARGGWNWMTVFLDVPLNFEDQIIVDRRHAGKIVTTERSYTVFGQAMVAAGDAVRKGKPLGLNEDGSQVVFDLDCEHARVVGVEESLVPFDGTDEPVMIVTLEVSYAFREGVKITNQHGNKGIVVLRELGTVHDPVHGETPIDVIVSARSVQKRKNFGQVLEAWTTLLHGPNNRRVVPDDLEVTEEKLRIALGKAGHSPEGTCKVQTPWGAFETICGWVHWGVTKTPEEQLWQGNDTWTENQRGLRQRGNKLSTVELKALTTLLGPGSAVVKEVLSHQQGLAEVTEYLRSLECLRGNHEDRVPVVDPEQFIFVPSGTGTFHGPEKLYGTIADERMYPDGCYLQLPFPLRVFLPDNPGSKAVEEVAQPNAYDDQAEGRSFEMDRLYVPAAALRQPWQHPTGKWALSDIATSLNQILEALARLKAGEAKDVHVANLVFSYLRFLSGSLSTKAGKISQYMMAVRYPWSSKATATLGENLPENTVEIHADMAKDLQVASGDLVLVERFPCLGFMSTRIQRVQVTDDPDCKYVIRVSGNSLVSMNLDFDGDVIYIMSFHTEAAKQELKENFHNPHPRVKEVLEALNGRKVPITQATSLSEVGLIRFETLTPKEHADLNATSLAVKLHTGPTIALVYCLMRIIEGGIPYQDREAHINVEVFLDKVGNSVFSQKHGTESLREKCVQAICLADAPALVALGFPERESRQLCKVIRERAAKIGVRSAKALTKHYERHLKEGRSNIISAIVRRCHPLYYATRANLHPIRLLDALETEPNDLVSHLVQRSLQK